MAYAATKPDEGTFKPRYGPKPDLHNFSLYPINGLEDIVVALDDRRIGSTSGRYFFNWFANKPNSFKNLFDKMQDTVVEKLHIGSSKGSQHPSPT